MAKLDLSPNEIAAYYRERVPDLKRSGSRWRGSCPIHQGDGDSFSVDPDTGLWFCHSQCRRGGDVYDLEREISGTTSFPDVRAAIDPIVGRGAQGSASSRVATTYDYTDEAGALLYQVVRYEPKGFRQRRPDGAGSWIWNLGGVRRVLYRLPELGAAQTVYLVEGEKDADRLASLGLTATTAPGGAGRWRPEYSDALAGKAVVILPDNDAPGRKDGFEKASALLGVAEVKVVELPDLPVKGDVSHWLDAGRTRGDLEDLVATTAVMTTDRLLKLEQRWFPGPDAPPSESNRAAGSLDEGVPWPEPEPLLSAEGPQPYPLDALPQIIRDAVNEVLSFTQVPDSMAACSALSALSLAAQGLVSVRRAEGLEGPASLYFLVLAESGERKSTVDGLFTVRIREFERQVAEQSKPEWDAYRADFRIWESAIKGSEKRLLDARKSGDSAPDAEEQLHDLEGSKPTPPRVPRLIYADATPEALARGLGETWPCAGVLSAEAGSVFGGHGMGRDSIMRNLALLNGCWDGRLPPSDRVTRECLKERATRLTCGLAVQPETLRSFCQASYSLARGTGFLARFMIAWPRSTQGTRFFKPAPKDWPALSAFHRRLRELLEAPVEFESDELRTTTLAMTPEAHELWVKFHDDVEKELSQAGKLSAARDFGSKAADNVARLAALFHTFLHGPVGEIGAELVRSAARIVTWHLLEACRFAGEIALPQSIVNAVALDAWLVDRCLAEGEPAVSRRDVQQYGPNPVRSSEALNEALQVLANAGRVHETVEGRKKLIEINPALLEEGSDGLA